MTEDLLDEIEEYPCSAKRFGDCLICHHTACGWCPDCSPQVPDWC